MTACPVCQAEMEPVPDVGFVCTNPHDGMPDTHVNAIIATVTLSVRESGHVDIDGGNLTGGDLVVLLRRATALATQAVLATTAPQRAGAMPMSPGLGSRN